MSWAKLSLFVLFAVALACGQVFFKLAAESLKGPLAVDARTALATSIRAVMARNDVILEELARRVEAQEGRHARRVHELEREIAELRGRGGEAPAPRLLSEAD